MPLFIAPLPDHARPTRFDSPLDKRLDAERKARRDAQKAEADAWFARFDAAAPPSGTVEDLKATLASLGGFPVPPGDRRTTLIKRCRARLGLDSPVGTYSLLTVHRSNPDGTVDGAWLQDHVGTLASARDRADATEAANSGSPVAVVPAVPFCGPADVFHSRPRLA